MDCAAKRERTLLFTQLILTLPPLLWAGNFVVGRAASSDVPPIMLAFARHFVALVILLPFGWTTMRRDIKRYWELRWQLIRVSLSGMVTFNLMVYSGLHSTTASNAQLMNSTIPVLIMALGTLLFGQRLSVTQIFGLFLSCAGVLTIILHGQFARLLALQFSQGDLIVFGAMISFALFSIWQRSFPADVGRLGLLGAQLTVAVTILSPFLLFEYLGGARTIWSTAAITEMLYVGIAAALLANLLYMFGIARVGPTRAGMFIHLVPLYGAFMSTALLGEHLHFYHGVGMAGIMAGLACSSVAGSDWPGKINLKTTGAGKQQHACSDAEPR